MMHQSQHKKKACVSEGKRTNPGVIDLPRPRKSETSVSSTNSYWTAQTSSGSSGSSDVSLGSPLSSLGEYPPGDGLEWDCADALTNYNANRPPITNHNYDLGEMDWFTYPTTNTEPWNTNWNFGTVPQTPSSLCLPSPTVATNAYDLRDYQGYAAPEDILGSPTPESTELPHGQTSQETHKKPERRSTRQKPAHGKDKSRHPTKHSPPSSSSHQPHSSKSGRKAPAVAANWSSGGNSESLSRTNHNLVEKQYRNRLNGQFDTLLSILPDTVIESRVSGSEERKVSKAEVLILAKQHISQLEKAGSQLKGERDVLMEKVNLLKGNWASGN